MLTVKVVIRVWGEKVWGVARGLKELMRAAQRAKSLPDVRPRRQRANLYSNYDASIDIRRSIKGGHFKAVFLV